MTKYKLVPVEATEEMIDAGMQCTGVKTQWSAMCEAAPSPWRPIAEAEEYKDGQQILITGGSLGKAVELVSWGPAAYNRSAKAYDRGWHHGPSHGYRPTHFIPLSALGMPGGEDE